MTKHKSQDERRVQIIMAAKECFTTMGYAHTRVDDIAKEAGLSKGGIYFHFKSKREIFDALYETEYNKTLSFVNAAQASDRPALEKLAQLGSMMLARFADVDEHRKLLAVLGEMGLREPDVYDKIREMHEYYVAALAQQIEQGVASGEFRNVDPRIAALVLKLLVDGIEQGFAVGYELDVTQLMTAGLDIVLHGLAGRGDAPT